MHLHPQMTTPLKTTFNKRSFPQIHSILPPLAHITCFAFVSTYTRVTCNEDDGGKLSTAIQAGCKKGEVLVGIALYEADVKRIPKPSLTCAKSTSTLAHAETQTQINELLPTSEKNLTSFVLTVVEPELHTTARTTLCC